MPQSEKPMSSEESKPRGDNLLNTEVLSELSATIREVKAGERGQQEPPRPAEVTMQMLIDAGFNAFGLQLFCESFADRAKSDFFAPFSFRFRGLKFTVERAEGEEIDTRHH